MTELLALLKTLCATPGLSGHEAPIRKILEKTWQPITDELSVSRLGSLHGLKSGTAPEPRPAILIAAHMDAIGLMVTGIVNGLLRVTEVGGLDARVLPGQLVSVHGRQDLPGVIVQPPAHLLPAEAQEGPVPLKYLLVDTGLRSRQVNQQVRIGDMISFAQEPIQLQGDTLAGRSLDNRASVAALTLCLEDLQTRNHAWDVWAVATTQEEETLGGARTSAFQLRPQIAVAVDVTWGESPGAPDHLTFPLDKGPTLGWGPNIHPGLHRSIKKTAEQIEVPFAVEVMPRHSGTDAFSIQIAAEGIPTMVVSIPLRYMHTPVEVVALKDIQRTARLLSEFITQLDIDYMNKLTLEESS
ncbi:MAG TPA: M20/M25/M40 family metallo-hydrolase [Anaerolineales bacterium]|nr:M20/M25/M40 family metallo-hydrolase [Anaerolineales bacterium]